MQMTLDGCIAGPKDEMDWLISSEDDWAEMFKDLKSVDTCLVGGKMYPGYAAYWRSVLTNPAASPQELAYAQFADRTPHIVFSHSISSVDWPNTRISGDVQSEIRKLREAPGKDMIVWGGATFASSLINLGVIDEYRIALNPTVLGSGKTLFNNIEERKKLNLIDARPLKSGIIIIRYRSSK